MTTRQKRKMSYVFFFLCFLNCCFLIHAVLTKTGSDLAFACVLQGVGLIFNLRLAVALYRDSQDSDLP